MNTSDDEEDEEEEYTKKFSKSSFQNVTKKVTRGCMPVHNFGLLRGYINVDVLCFSRLEQHPLQMTRSAVSLVLPKGMTIEDLLFLQPSRILSKSLSV